MKGKSLGLLVGAVVGVVWAWLGFKDLLLVALCGFIGWLIVGVLEGRARRPQFLREPAEEMRRCPRGALRAPPLHKKRDLVSVRSL